MIPQSMLGRQGSMGGLGGMAPPPQLGMGGAGNQPSPQQIQYHKMMNTMGPEKTAMMMQKFQQGGGGMGGGQMPGMMNSQAPMQQMMGGYGNFASGQMPNVGLARNFGGF